MNVLTARARKLNPDGSLGEVVIGYPVQGIEYLYLYETSKYFDIPVPVDPATLNYETGKLDCKGRMIYGGMKVRVYGTFDPMTTRNDSCISFVLVPSSHPSIHAYLQNYESYDLEIIKDGE